MVNQVCILLLGLEYLRIRACSSLRTPPSTLLFAFQSNEKYMEMRERARKEGDLMHTFVPISPLLSPLTPPSPFPDRLD
jgi:hypothetical protein